MRSDGHHTREEDGRSACTLESQIGHSGADRSQLGMGMFILSNLVGSTIQITTLPLPVLSTLQAV